MNQAKKMNTGAIAVIGGSGFIGRYIVAELAGRGYRLRVLVRRADKAKFLLPLGTPGQIALVPGHAGNLDSLKTCVAGCQAVINAVGILAEQRRGDFTRLHADLPETLGKLVAEMADRTRLIHISALGASKTSSSRYARSKAEGEVRLLNVFPRAVILRPSLVFGSEDMFFNRFARMALWSPILPLIGGGKSKFQPVYVGNVAEAAVVALHKPNAVGKTYVLAGGQVYSFAELLRYILVVIQRPRPLLPLPFWLMVLPALCMEWLPRPLLTQDQLRLLKSDSIAPRTSKTSGGGLAELGITPLPLELIVPQYIRRFRPGGGMGIHSGLLSKTSKVSKE
ncbi:MAG: complex I NDUFA9 subunit family protein [Proteobacteria bacterium]|nr:complex I NDUFA9 subunit family protein [Pseudomonadota bacterium]